MEKIKPAIFSPSLLCNNMCKGCGGLSIRRKNQHSLSLEEIEKTLEFFLSKDVNTLWISGGEPTIFKNLIPLLEMSKKKGFAHITLFTNGRKLKNLDFVKKIIEAGCDGFHISLHGSNERIHDFITGVRGAFQETIKGIENCLHFKDFLFILSVEHVILSLNVDNLTDFIYFIANFKSLDVCQFTYPELRGKENLHLLPSLQKIEIQLDKIELLKKNKITPIFEGIPPCILPKAYKKYYGDFHRKKRKVYSIGYNDLKNKKFYYSQILGSKIRTYGSKCKNCIYKKFDICAGVYRTYLEKFGEEELKPNRI